MRTINQNNQTYIHQADIIEMIRKMSLPADINNKIINNIACSRKEVVHANFKVGGKVKPSREGLKIYNSKSYMCNFSEHTRGTICENGNVRVETPHMGTMDFSEDISTRWELAVFQVGDIVRVARGGQQRAGNYKIVDKLCTGLYRLELYCSDRCFLIDEEAENLILVTPTNIITPLVCFQHIQRPQSENYCRRFGR